MMIGLSVELRDEAWKNGCISVSSLIFIYSYQNHVHLVIGAVKLIKRIERFFLV